MISLLSLPISFYYSPPPPYGSHSPQVYNLSFKYIGRLAHFNEIPRSGCCSCCRLFISLHLFLLLIHFVGSSVVRYFYVLLCAMDNIGIEIENNRKWWLNKQPRQRICLYCCTRESEPRREREMIVSIIRCTLFLFISVHFIVLLRPNSNRLKSTITTTKNHTIYTHKIPIFRLKHSYSHRSRIFARGSYNRLKMIKMCHVRALIAIDLLQVFHNIIRMSIVFVFSVFRQNIIEVERGLMISHCWYASNTHHPSIHRNTNFKDCCVCVLLLLLLYFESICSYLTL